MYRKISTKGRSNEKRAFFAGVFWLTASGLLVKIAGLCFKIPMNYIVGDTGMGYYGSAYSVYTFLYMLSTSGLPVAMSVMISEERSRGEVRAARQTFRVAMSLFVVLGAVTASAMLLFSHGFASAIRSDDSASAIAVTAPTMLFICVSCAVRGYFQGCGNMVPTAVSQLIEAVGKLAIGVFAAIYATRAGLPAYAVAAYAASGLTVGTFFGMIYLITVKLLRGERDIDLPCECKNEYVPKKRETVLTLIKKSLPITVSASVMSLSGIMDTVLIQRVLRSSGMSAENAASVYGNYTSLAVPMFNLPPVFVYPVAYSLVPAVSALFARKHYKKAAERIESALKYATVVGLPCALGMSAMAEPVLMMIYREESAHIAAPLLTCLAPSSFFVCILAVTNSVLEACGHEKSPVISMLAGAAVKCVSGVFLLKRYGIMGAPLSTLACYLTVTAINFAFTVKYTKIRLSFYNVAVPLCASLLSSVSAVWIYRTLCGMTPQRIACLIGVCAAALIYAIVLLLTGCVKINEITEIINRKGKIKNET